MDQIEKRRNLTIAMVITLIFMVVEVAGGYLTNSLALLADAGHMATDAGALALALFAGWLATRPANDQRSFGFLRAEVLAAAVNAAVLIALSFFILWEAWQRFGDPPEIDTGPMLAVAIAGLIANGLSAWVLSRGGHHHHDLNSRGAFLHVVGDFLGSVGTILAALIMIATGWWYADPLLSAGIGLLILYSAFRLLRESVDVLLEATPPGLDMTEMRSRMAQVPGVVDVHDLHAWVVTSGFTALSGHVEVSDDQSWNTILLELDGLLHDDFGIHHITLQPEPASDNNGSHRGCSFDSPDGMRSCFLPKHEHSHAGHLHAG